MGVCTRRALAFDPFYAWKGWNFVNVIGLLIAIGLFYYAYIHVRVYFIRKFKKILNTE